MVDDGKQAEAPVPDEQTLKSGSGEAVRQQLEDKPVKTAPGTATPSESGVADEDPLSAHPT